jgi:hypothetical protein
MVDLDLPDLARRIAGAGRVMLSESDAEAATGCNGHAAEAIAELLDSGWLAVWDGPDGAPWLHLTTAAAAVLELEIAQDVKGVDRWFRRGEARDLGPGPDGKICPESDVYRADGPGLDDRADPNALEPIDILSAHEPDPETEGRLDTRTDGDDRAMAALAAFRQARRGRAPRPSLVLTGTVAWPPDPMPDGSSCPVCRGAPLAVTTYCAWCARSGAEDFLEEVLEAEKPREYVWTEGPLQLAGGMGSATGLDDAAFLAMMAVMKADADEERKRRAREAQERAKATRKTAKAKRDYKQGWRPKKTG